MTEVLVSKVNPGGFWVGIGKKVKKIKLEDFPDQGVEGDRIILGYRWRVKALRLYLIRDMDLEDDYVFLQCLPALLLKALIRRCPGW